MAGPLKPIGQHDFSGGANAVVNPYDCGPKQVLRLINMILDEHGSLRTVDGTAIQTTAPVSESGHKLLLPISWIPIGSVTYGTQQNLIIATPASVSSILYSRTSMPWSAIGTFQSNNLLPQAAILNNLLCITDGYHPPVTWDGNTFATLSNLLGALHLVNHAGFLWAGNTQGGSSTYDGPSVLRQSDLNAPNTWNNSNVAFIGKDDGSQIMGLGLLTIAEAGIPPTDTLVCFKNQSAYQIVGNMGTGGGGPSSNFSIQEIKSDMGCYASRSIQFCSGYGIIRLSHRGFALYDSVEDKLISEEVRPYLFGRDDITGIDWTQVQYSWAAQAQNPPYYICFCPVAGSSGALVRGFLYDLVRQAWTIVDLSLAGFSVASLALVAVPGSQPGLYLTDVTSGHMRRWFAQDGDWDGLPIAWSTRPRPVFDGSQMQPMYLRRLALDILSALGFTLTYTVSTPAGVAKGPGTVIVPAVAAPYTSQPQIDLDLNTSAAWADLSGTGPVRIRGLDWHARKKPLRSTKL